jgi:hypothetical protein
VALLVLLLRAMHKAALHADPDDPLPAAVRDIGMGLAIGGLLLHVWIYFAVALTFWATAGLLTGEDQSTAAPPPTAPSPHL